MQTSGMLAVSCFPQLPFETEGGCGVGFEATQIFQRSPFSYKQAFR
ncbi:hypothetical protein [Okeania sp. KiyG1]|nr:hypothetical protein [Okeania sp. KiyG1]